MAKSSLMWDSLLQLTGQLVEGKSVLEDLVAESPKMKKHAALDRGFSMKRKRSPRNHINQERVAVLEKKSGSPNNKKKKSGFHEKNPKKRRRCLEEIGESSSEKKLKESMVYMDMHTIIDNSNNNIQSSLPVPEAIKRRIIETGGRLEGAVCVIEKALFRTDVDSAKCRLSVPQRQVRERFLFPGDKERLLAHSDGGIRATLVLPSPCFEEYEVLFGLWASNTTYVLKNGWNKVGKTLRDGRVIRLWAFRRKFDDLCFALELL